MHASEVFRAIRWGDAPEREDRVFVPQGRFGRPIAEVGFISYSSKKDNKLNIWQHLFEHRAHLLELVDPPRALRADEYVTERTPTQIHAEARMRDLMVAPIVDTAGLAQMGIAFELREHDGRRHVLPGVDVAVGWDELHQIHAVVLCGPRWLRYQIAIQYDRHGSVPYVTAHGIEG